MDLHQLVSRLAGRKGLTEADIQSDIRALLLYGDLDLEESDLVVLESPVAGGRRIDIEAGASAIEVKKSLEGPEIHKKAVEQLGGYLSTRQSETGLRYAGVLTDGVTWELYYQGVAGPLFVTSLHLKGTDADVAALTVWLEGVLATAQAITPSPREIERRLGSSSTSFALDYVDLMAIYAESNQNSDVALKRELWSRLLSSALGTHFEDSDKLFVLHSYLVISAELIAHAAIGFPIVGQSPRALLSGEVFRSNDLGGVVEADFFDWPAELGAGKRFVASLARRIARFDWNEVHHDVLKSLYESVIDAATRKELGEYYTPDWLAEGIVEKVVTDPLNQRALDPSCGSGTFLFWAVRRYLEEAERAGRTSAEAIEGVVSHVAGIDLHPVAVALARVTYLLAIGSDRLQDQRPAFSVPVYLGDSLRWDQPDDQLFTSSGITIFTTDGAQLFDQKIHFPDRVVADAGRFDQLIAELAAKASQRAAGSTVPSVEAMMKRLAVHPDDRDTVKTAFKQLCDLHDEGRDHIWGYYIRNLARPLWFTRPENRADVLIGNPPWLSYRFMSAGMQASYRQLAADRGLWAGGKVTTHQDLSDLFVVRATEQYLQSGGSFGFVMPAAVLTRRQFEGFRSGYFPAQGSNAAFDFSEPWDLRGLAPAPFPVPSAVVFGERSGKPTPLPDTAQGYAGRVTAGSGRWAEAEQLLTKTTVGLQRSSDDVAQSPYLGRFYQGATILPRVLLTVAPAPPGPLGSPAGTRRVRSLRSKLEKAPWKDLQSLEGLVESQFVMSCHLGATIAPFRPLEPIEALIPWSNGQLLDGANPGLDEYPHLAAWWRRAEQLWEDNRGVKSKITLRERLDYHGELTRQFPIPTHRVVYTKSGNRIAAARLSDQVSVVDHKLYWATASSEAEAHYLTAILNSEALHTKVEPLMSEGLFGKRDVDKYVFAVPFPTYDPDDPGHAELARLGELAEDVAAKVDTSAATTFQQARTGVRDALADNGVGIKIESAVARLIALTPAAPPS